VERILCLDYGDRRIGIAVSDLLNITAQPIGYITINGDRDAISQIKSYITQFQIKKIVLGLPKNMDGSEGERALKTRRFADKLTESFGVAIDYFDERLTSVSADRALNDLNVSGRNKKGKTDTLSAVIILQNYMCMLK
jgi:putative Holliday junction resolvase